MENLATILCETKQQFDEMRGNRAYAYDDEYSLKLTELLYSAMYSHIHEYLVNLKDGQGESEIRANLEYVSMYVLPFLKNKLSYNSKKIAKIKNGKINEQGKEELNKETKLYEQFAKLYEDFFALSSFRNIENFALYMEWGMPENDKIWKYNLNCFKGFWHYANKMVIDNSVKYLEKQCPTGYGKSYCDTVMIAFILGVDHNNDIMKVVGNPSLVTDMSNKLVKYMCNPNYAKVFPYYAKYECDSGKMFDICREGGNNQPARLLVNGSRKGTSVLIFNKDTPIDGGKWKKRKYDDNNSFEIFSGTTYHIYDFLSSIKRKYGGEEAVQSKINKYTKYNAKHRSVFISVPKLDYDTDESTYPNKYSTEEARKDRLADYNTFMAMDMQEPMPIEGCAFSYDNLNCYDVIPHDEEDRENESCWAMLDPARTGANYVSMPIMLPIGNKHYLKDCIFQMKSMDKIYSVIISKIEQHHITRLHIEKNTDTSLKSLLEGKLREKGINYCTITEVYSYKKKENKIYDNEESIKSSIVFPAFELYAQGSEMGKFMKYVTSFSYVEKNLYDDSIDSLAMYSEYFLNRKKVQNSIRTIKLK